MSREREERAREVLQAALERAEAERGAFLDRACAGDDGLRRVVESLLAARGPDTGPSPAAGSSGQQTWALPDKPAPRALRFVRVGPYRIEREVGRGGMGVVYLAVRDDDQYSKKVALKLMKASMDSDSIVRRFRHERQILASLDHPGIARLLDGGATADGRLYFVMEHVAGDPVDRYCDSRRLSLAERVELFRSVCAAVHFAHQNLVVHRDLKPANILVTTEGQPKLLDFGIAKILASPLGEVVDLTATWERVLTPEYASPEQVRGEAISTASDVYSLGVLLYELLTGRPPYRFKSPSFPEISRTVCEVDPEPPSSAVARRDERVDRDGRAVVLDPETVSRLRAGNPEGLRRRLSGDLDAIVLKAMRKEPQKRYGSVEQLSEDLRRHLEGLPVAARKGTIRYRAGKFVRRHRGTVAAGAVVIATLVAGVVTTAWQARLAGRQRDLAVRAAHTMVHELAAGLERMTGPTEARLGLLAQAARVFDEAVATTPERGPRRQQVESNLVLCRAYRNLGDAKAALVRGEAAVAQARRLAPGRSAPARDRALLAHALVELGDSLADDHRPDDAGRAYREALSLLEALALAGEARLVDRGHLVRVLTRQADQLYERGGTVQARDLYERAFAAGSALHAAEPGNVDYGTIDAVAVERMGDVSYYLDHDTEAACERYRAALELRRRTADLAPDDPVVLRGLAIAMQNVAWCAEERRAWAEARPLYEESVGIQRRLLALDPHNTLLAPQLMGGLGQTGNVLRLQGDVARAASWYDEAVRVAVRFRDEGRSTPVIDAKAADIAELHAEALLHLGRTADARRSLELAERILRGLVAGDPKNVEYVRLSEETERLRRRLGGRPAVDGRAP